jgi:ABC-type multidrug transport system fused ATPase/permease subunit
MYVLAGKQGILALLLFAILFNSLLETIGVGLVGPFMGLATNPEAAIGTESFLGIVYHRLGFSSPNQFVACLGLAMVVIFCVKSILKFRIQRSIFRFGYRQQGELRLRLLKTYLRLPYTFHLKNNTSLLIQNIVTETESFCNSVLISGLNLIVHFAVLCALLVLLIVTDPLATAAIFVVLLIVLLLYGKYKNQLVLWGRQQSDSQTEIIRIINHSLGGFKETRVIGCESYFEEQMEKEATLYAEAISSLLAFKVLPLIVVESLIIIFLVSFTSISLFLEQSPEKLTAILSIFAVASIRIIPTTNQLISALASVRARSYTLDRLYITLKELDETTLDLQLNGGQKCIVKNQANHGYSDLEPVTFVNQIELNNITYYYPGVNKPSLKNISLSIRKGQSIALIGKSGAGKTTLVDTILGLLHPSEGEISVDDVSVYSNLRSWQKLIGYIPQSIFLLDDSIEKNVAFGVHRDAIDQVRLKKAIRAAQLTDLIETLPDGVKTQVGERGVRLSGGQRQRIGIARALYHQSEILILDEATAALDNETESLITEAIQSLSGTKTLIIIAHRLTTVKQCDVIYEMRQGQIVKFGSYKEVVMVDS